MSGPYSTIDDVTVYTELPSPLPYGQLTCTYPYDTTIEYKLMDDIWQVAANSIAGVWRTYLHAVLKGDLATKSLAATLASTILQGVAEEVAKLPEFNGEYDIRLFVQDPAGTISAFGGTAAKGDNVQLRSDVILAFQNATTWASSRTSTTTSEFTTYVTSRLSRFNGKQPDMYSHVLRIAIGHIPPPV